MLRSQSAMEYLMTYGWAILIIAVILGALYQVGVFNPYTFSPKVGAGACKVARGIVDGQVTSSKVGTCNNALPQFVIVNGNPETATISGPTQMNGATAITVSSWALFPSIANSAWIINDGGYSGGSWMAQLYVHANGQVEADFGCPTCGWLVVVLTGAGAVTTNQWYNIAATWQSGSGAQVYVDGVPQTLTYSVGTSGTTGTLGGFSTYDTMYVGTASAGGNGYGAQMANLQMYNTSIGANGILALYKKGIGGAPDYLGSLTGWWPLNGDAKDYSGNGNDGSLSGATFTGSWTAGYSAP